MRRRYSTGWHDVCFSIEHLLIYGSIFGQIFSKPWLVMIILRSFIDPIFLWSQNKIPILCNLVCLHLSDRNYINQ
uniref:Uncharacterized protein n=1 Tax=Sus scrofa TaxID=9823 RepID=A0A4X1TEK1_PIG